MKAMILAAGLGTRLGPLTKDRPKALVEVAGHTLLEITLARLREFGINEVIINVHHFAGMVADYLQSHNNFGMRIELSREDTLLDTGGGLKKAAPFFLQNASADHDSGAPHEPFILHNVDVISTIDLQRMVQFHNERNALATLAVQQRQTSRYLLFGAAGQLRGRQTSPAPPVSECASHEFQPLAFSGIHVISPRIFELLSEEGPFSIVTSYLRLASQGQSIIGFRADSYHWRDLGRPESLMQAAQDLHDFPL